MVTTIYLIRHGESLGNIQKIFLGHTDWDLTELGYKQAACTAAASADIPVDVVLSSDLSRAFHTAQAVADIKQLSVLPDPGFREIYAGQWEGMTFEDLMEQYPDDYAVWRTDIGRAKATGGESVAELYGRVSSALSRAVDTYAGKTIVIGTHATPIRVLRTCISGLPVEEAARIPWVSNASITKLICEDGIYRIEYADRHDHLGSLSTRLPANV